MNSASPLGDFHEEIANETIANWLSTRGSWETQPERVGAMQGSAKRPDIIFHIILQQQGRMSLIIENEYAAPAVGDARKRLGDALKSDK